MSNKILILTVILVLGITSCHDKEKDATPLQNSAFIGTWVEVTPCESCRAMIMDIKSNGTIVHTYPNREASQNETYTYTLLVSRQHTVNPHGQY